MALSPETVALSPIPHGQLHREMTPREMTLHTHSPGVPIILEDIFGWVREGNAFQVRVWLDDTEHDLNQG